MYISKICLLLQNSIATHLVHTRVISCFGENNLNSFPYSQPCSLYPLLSQPEWSSEMWTAYCWFLLKTFEWYPAVARLRSKNFPLSILPMARHVFQCCSLNLSHPLLSSLQTFWILKSWSLGSVSVDTLFLFLDVPSASGHSSPLSLPLHFPYSVVSLILQVSILICPPQGCLPWTLKAWTQCTSHLCVYPMLLLSHSPSSLQQVLLAHLNSSTNDEPCEGWATPSWVHLHMSTSWHLPGIEHIC